MLQRKFILPLAFLIGINLLVKPFWVLFVERKVQLIVGESQYGLYFSLFSLSFILNVVLDFGIQIYNTRRISIDPEDLSSRFIDLAWIKFFLSIAYFIISVFIGFLFGYSQEAIYLLLWVCANQFLLAFIAFFRSNIIARQRNYLDAFFSVFDKVLMIVFVLFYIHFSDTFSIFNFAQMQFLALFASFTIAGFFVFSNSNFSLTHPNFTSIFLLLKETYPYALMVLFMSIYQRIDGVLLERILVNGAEQAGVYAASYRILDAAGNMFILFGTTLLPLFSRNLLNKNELRRICKLASILILSMSIALAIGAWIYGERIIYLMYHQSSDNWVSPLKFLMIGLIGMCMVFVYGTLLSAGGKMKEIICLVAIGSVLSVFLNLYFIPIHGATGAAISFAITQLFMGFGHVFLGVKFLNKA